MLDNVDAPIETTEGYACLNCDNEISPDVMFCSEACDITYNEDLKAELEDLREVFKTRNLFDD
jgi:hypothetical protein